MIISFPGRQVLQLDPLSGNDLIGTGMGKNVNPNYLALTISKSALREMLATRKGDAATDFGSTPSPDLTTQSYFGCFIDSD